MLGAVPEMPAEVMDAMGRLMEGQRALLEQEQLDRIEAKLDRILGFNAALVDLVIPLLPKKVGAVVGPAMKAALE